MCDTPNEGQLALTAFQHSASNLDNILHQTQNDLVTLIGYDSPGGRGDTYGFRDIYLDFFVNKREYLTLFDLPVFLKNGIHGSKKLIENVLMILFLFENIYVRGMILLRSYSWYYEIFSRLIFFGDFLNSPSSPHESLRLRVRIRGTISTLLENIDRVMSLSQFYENMHPDFTYELQAIQRKCREYEAQINRE